MCLSTLPAGIGRSRNSLQELSIGARSPRGGNAPPPQSPLPAKPRGDVTILSAARPRQPANDRTPSLDLPLMAASSLPASQPGASAVGIAEGPALPRRTPAAPVPAARAAPRLIGAPVPGPARTAGVPSGGILMRPPVERRKNLRPQPTGGADGFFSDSPSFPRTSNFGGRGKPLRPPVVGQQKAEQDRFRNNPEIFRQGERYPRADTRKGLEFWEANGEITDRWLAEVSGLLTEKDRASEDGTFARKVHELGLNPQRIQIFTEALRPGADRAVILKRFEQLFVGKAPEHKKALESALRGILDAKTAADKTQAIRNAAFLSHADVSKGENKAPNKFRAVLNAFGAGISPTGDVAGVAAALDRGDESRSKQIGILLDRIKRLSRLENAEERRREAPVLNRQVRALIPHTTTAALFHKAITGAALGEAPPSWLDSYAERSTILPGVARATRNFHDGLFPVDPRIEGDLGVRSAGIAGEVASLVGIGGVGAAAKAAGGLRDGGRKFIRSFDEIQRQKKSAADDLAESPGRNPDIGGESKDGVASPAAPEPKLKDSGKTTPAPATSPASNFNLPPVTRAQAEQEYLALNMPAASTDLWVDIRTNKRGYLDAHENDLHKGHALRKHVRISDQDLKDRVFVEGRCDASRFLSQAIAEAAISRIFDVRRQEIAKWFHKKKKNSEMRFEVEDPFGNGRPVGEIFEKGMSRFLEGKTAVVKLIKTNDSEFKILTAFVDK